MNLNITPGERPSDETPPVVEEDQGWYDPEYPHSTPEHPYGYFPKSDGTPDFDRPRKRRPHGTRKSSGSGSAMPASPKQATAAAAILARMNGILGMGLMALGMPMTATQLATANAEFESMAAGALSTDPALCRKILSAGASSGKAQLAVAYAMLGAAVAPTAALEIKTARERRNSD